MFSGASTRMMGRTLQRLRGLRVRFTLAMGAFGIGLGVLMGG